MTDSRLFDFFNEYPVFPTATFSINAVAFIPLFCLLYIAQRAPLHSNCRYILCVWSLSFGCVYSINLAIALLDFNNFTGYMPLDIHDHNIRFKLYEWHVRCTTFCSLVEIALSIERIIAIIHPRRYHFSDIAWKSLFVLTITLMMLAYVIETIVHGGKSDTIPFVSLKYPFLDNTSTSITGCVAVGVVELCVLATGGAAVKVCCIRYKIMFGKASLTARYQVNEAHEMSKAMMPAYAVAFLLKISCVLTLIIFFTAGDDYGVILGYLQAYYFLTNAINGSFSLTNLLLKHPQLRKQTLRKLRKLFKMKVKPQNKIVPMKTDTDLYFSVLAENWNR